MKKFSWGSLFGYLAILVFYGMFCFIVYDGASKYALRQNTEHIKLKATIASVDHYTEMDEGFEEDRYKAYVSYDYDGREYLAYYKTYYSKPKLGKTVSVLIDPENPGELLPSNGELGIITVLCPVFLTGLAGVAWWYIREKIKEKDPDDPDIAKRSRNTALSIVAALLAALSLWFYSAKNSWVLLIFSVIALAVVSRIAFRKPKPAE